MEQIRDLKKPQIVGKNYSTRSQRKGDDKFTFIDLYSGIGGFRLALEKLGGVCLGFSEIDKEAIKVYKDNFFNTNKPEIEFGDVTSLEKLPLVDVLVGGVPCQSWSVAGKMRGFDDPRGRLWLDTIRLVKINKPKSFIFENVKGLMDPRNKENLNLIISNFKKLGYFVEYKLLNSSDFGLPQNRERIYIVGIRKDQMISKGFEFPSNKKKTDKLYKVIDNLVMIKEEKGRDIKFNNFFIFCDTRNGHTTIHSWDIIDTTDREKDICLTILKNRRKKIYGSKDGNPMSFRNTQKLISDIKISELNSLIEKGIIKKDNHDGFDFVNSKNSSGINGVYRIYLPDADTFSTLTATGTRDMVATKTVSGKDHEEFKSNFIREIYKKKNFREISSRETSRLQGFPSSFKMHPKDQIAKKHFGNAVSVPVVSAVMEAIIKTINLK